MQGLRPQWVDHVLPQAVPFLLLDTQEVESGYARSRSDIAKDTCLLWVTGSSLDVVVGWYERLVKPNKTSPSVEYSPGEEIM